MIEFRFKPDLDLRYVKRGFVQYYVCLRDTQDYITASKAAAIKWVDELLRKKCITIISPTAEEALRYDKLIELGKFRLYDVVNTGVALNTLGSKHDPLNARGRPGVEKKKVSNQDYYIDPTKYFQKRYEEDAAFRMKVDVKRVLGLPDPSALD